MAARAFMDVVDVGGMATVASLPTGGSSVMFADFHFLRPFWLLALLIVPIFMQLRHRTVKYVGAWRRVVDPALLPHVMARDMANSNKSRRLITLAVTLCYTLAVIALAGPVWKRVPRPVFKDRSALVILLDLSKSMDAQDIKPSRLARARFKIADLLSQRGAGLTALVVYAADAYSVVPLTDDTATIMSQLPVLETALMPAQGSAPDRAVTRALDLFEHSGVRSGDLLLLTDSISADDAEKIRTQLQNKSYRLSVLAVGTSQGAPIPIGGGEFAHDNAGKLVLARLDTGEMEKLAQALHGHVVVSSSDPSDVTALSTLFHAAVATNAGQATDLLAHQWREEGPWLLLPVLPLMALLFRRGLLLSLAFVAVLTPRPSCAGTWNDLWWRSDQQAAKALAHGDAAAAALRFQDRRWQAVARYRNGDFAGAAKSLQDARNSDDFYNRGNALARTGQFDEAIAAYDQALALDKNNADAQYNRDLLRKLQQSKDQKSNSTGKDGDKSQQDQQQPNESGRSTQNESGKSNRGDSSQQSPSSTNDADHAPQNEGQSDQNQNPDKKLDALLARKRALQPTDTNSDSQQYHDKLPPQPTVQPGEHNEQDQADEQWLRRIPDDPGGLLRRKFYYQYSQSSQVAPSDEPW
ncbi:MAG: VWA domain-containing protein [Gammaproteobacteria bacterium]